VIFVASQNPNMKDSLSWGLPSSEVFTIKSALNVLGIKVVIKADGGL